MLRLFLKSCIKWCSAPFALVLKGPERLHVRVMARNARLGFVSQIKQGKRADVVKVPGAVVSPSHAGLKQGFDVVAEGWYRNPQSLHRRDAARFSQHCLVQPVPKILRDAALEVLCQLLRVICARHRQMARSVFRAPFTLALSLRLVVRWVLTSHSVSLQVVEANPFCGLFRGIQNSSLFARRHSLCLHSQGGFLSVAADAGIVQPTQPGQFWMSGAWLACARLQERPFHTSILTLTCKPKRDTFDAFHAQACSQVLH